MQFFNLCVFVVKPAFSGFPETHFHHKGTKAQRESKSEHNPIEFTNKVSG